jgi:predicted MPP superfamily phosphohydrolase
MLQTADVDDRGSLRRRLTAFVVVVQSILWIVHAIVGVAAASFLDIHTPPQVLTLSGILGGLSLTFVPASMLAFRSRSAGAKAFYRVAVVWLGFLNYLFFGALLAWVLDGMNRVIGSPIDRIWIGGVVGALSLLTALAAFLNAGRIRIQRKTVSLPNLPELWKGRTLAVVSDIHLGHVRGAGFLTRLVAMIARENPDLVVVPGDLYDGTAVDAAALAEPWAKLSPPYGTYFVTGNHDEFTDPARLLAPLSAAGVRTLANEVVQVDGLQIAGIHDGDHRDPVVLRSLLRGLKLDRSKASLLLAHSPINLRIAEEAGLSLQISGHTHGGQFLPWTWVVDRIYGAYASGLHAFGELQVLTSVGAGTWGPPMRLGTNPEIVLLTFR